MSSPTSTFAAGETLRELHLFAGAGGGILGGLLLGHTCVCAVEIEPYCRRVLLQRQRDGILPKFPIWDDVRTFDGRPWRGLVDIVCGGFPCQDISVAGSGAGIEGERSGLWSEFARIIGEIRPQFAFVENSPALTSRGLGRILADLAEMGMDAQWGILGASDANAPHLRKRIWVLANAQHSWLQERWGVGDVVSQDKKSFGIHANGFQGLRQQAREVLAHTNSINGEGRHISAEKEWAKSSERQARLQGGEYRRSKEWPTEPNVGRVAHGVAKRVDRIRALGNGQVPAVVALAWRILAAIAETERREVA